MSSDASTEDDFVQSLARGLAVIETFGDGHELQTLSDVAARAGISRAAARRLLHTLVSLGYAAFDGKRFALRPRVLRLGYAYLGTTSAWDVARPSLEKLVGLTGESCSAAVLDDTDIVHVVRLPSTRRLMSIAVKVGDRLPAHASAMGRVLLAAASKPDLEAYFRRTRLDPITPKTVTDAAALRRLIGQAREQGHAVVDGELDLGLQAVAVPVRDREDRVIGAIALSRPSARGEAADGALRLLPPLADCAREIHEALSRLPRVAVR